MASVRVVTGGERSARRVAVALLAASLLVWLTGCGDDGGGSDQLVVLRVVMANDWAGAPPVVDAVRDFEADHPGVRVDIQGVLFEFVADTVRAARSRGEPPDVAQGHAFSAGAQGLAAPLDDLWRGRLVPHEFLPGAVEDVTWAGRRYGVPLDTNALLMLYNDELFRQAGVAPPGDGFDFATLRTAAAALSTSDGSRRAIGLPSSTWHTYGWIRANGGEVVEVGEDGRPRFTFDSAPVVEAVDALGALVRDGLAFPPAGVAGDRTDAFDLFRSDSAAMHASGSWDLATLRRAEGSDRYRVAVLPKGVSGTTEGTAMGGSSLYVPRGSKHRALAFEFMLHLTSDRYALRLAREEGRLPVRLRVYRHPYFQSADLQTILAGLKTARPFFLEAFPEAHEAFGEAIDAALAGRRDAASALREAQARAQASVGPG